MEIKRKLFIGENFIFVSFYNMVLEVNLLTRKYKKIAVVSYGFLKNKIDVMSP